MRVDLGRVGGCISRPEMRQGFRVSVGADADGVGKVSAAFAEFAETHGVPAGVRRSVNVALDELLANERAYGMAGRDACSVTVEVELDEDRLTVTVTDDGPPFDPFSQAAPDTTLPLDERPLGARRAARRNPSPARCP